MASSNVPVWLKVGFICLVYSAILLLVYNCYNSVDIKYTISRIRISLTGKAYKDADNQTLSSNKSGNISVVIGMGLTSKHALAKFPNTFLERIPIFGMFLKSFCETASTGYSYYYYIAYDINDRFYINEYKRRLFEQRFENLTNKMCKHLSPIALQMVKCNHSGRPAWAQNDAMMAAYNHGHDFFYRVNDDTIFITKNWTSIFIAELRNMKPPLLGVVGPNHSGGNQAILTYDFVHRTHVDIFGYYYPRDLPWWYADDWVTKIYRPERSKKIMRVRLRHTLALGQRYSRQKQTGDFVGKVIHKGWVKVHAYLNATTLKH